MGIKVNLDSFTVSQLTAKLLTISRNWSRQPASTTLNKKKAMSWARKTIKDNFIYEDFNEDTLTMNLLLFLMGNEKNIFSKTLK